MGVSENNGSHKSSILISFSIIYHPFWGTSIFGNTHIYYLLTGCMILTDLTAFPEQIAQIHGKLKVKSLSQWPFPGRTF